MSLLKGITCRPPLHADRQACRLFRAQRRLQILERRQFSLSAPSAAAHVTAGAAEAEVASARKYCAELLSYDSIIHCYLFSFPFSSKRLMSYVQKIRSTLLYIKHLHPSACAIFLPRRACLECLSFDHTRHHYIPYNWTDASPILERCRHQDVSRFTPERTDCYSSGIRC